MSRCLPLVLRRSCTCTMWGCRPPRPGAGSRSPTRGRSWMPSRAVRRPATAPRGSVATASTRRISPPGAPRSVAASSRAPPGGVDRCPRPPMSCSRRIATLARPLARATARAARADALVAVQKNCRPSGTRCVPCATTRPPGDAEGHRRRPGAAPRRAAPLCRVRRVHCHVLPTAGSRAAGAASAPHTGARARVGGAAAGSPRMDAMTARL